mmetsp:Transcript_9601/g.24846  ORF Transcript_9601/g.24846 Transcript_9601/m.24846 type:complete len:100 (+) Transcript_9601:14-313(+)
MLTGTNRIQMADSYMPVDARLTRPEILLDYIEDEAAQEDMRLVATANILKISPQHQTIIEYRSDVAAPLAYELMESPGAAFGDDVTVVMSSHPRPLGSL